jgi:hypothetical protein
MDTNLPADAVVSGASRSPIATMDGQPEHLALRVPNGDTIPRGLWLGMLIILSGGEEWGGGHCPQ